MPTADQTLPAEFDPVATETSRNRVLPFARACVTEAWGYVGGR